MRVNGNIEGIKDIYIETLDGLYDMENGIDEVIDRDILMILADMTDKINKEISVFISRRGRVLDVTIGDYSTVNLPSMDLRRGEKRLSGIRCIHTHPSGDGHLSSVDISALTGLRLDAIAAVGIKESKITQIYIGLLAPEDGVLNVKYNIHGPYDFESIYLLNILDMIRDVEREITLQTSDETEESRKERVLLIGLNLPVGEGSSEDLLDELAELARTAGAVVAGRILQKRYKIDSAYYIGSGKAKELSLVSQAYDIDTIIFDDELSGAQVRNLEESTGVKVIDRTTLILDIFAMRAATREGKLQVELAQQKYRLPRLIGLGKVLSRTGGGIGTRGPGEKKLEMDKRYIRERINELEEELDEVRKNRNIQREKRQASRIPIISLVGYTNSGKSTLRNMLSKMYPSDKSIKKDDVLEANMLFATLDPTTRLIKLPKGHDALVSDTVGFIRKLPHDLVEAFRATLEEVVYSDMLIHVVDSSAQNVKEQIDAVNHVLEQLNTLDKPSVIALNKIDRLTGGDQLELLRANRSNTFEISALNGEGLDNLMGFVEDMVFEDTKIAVFNIPYDRMSLKSAIYNECRVLNEDYSENGLILEVEADSDAIKKFGEYLAPQK